MTTETDLLPLPAENYVDDEGLWETRYGPYSSEQMKDYARANVARAVAPLQAEIEALRAEVAEMREFRNNLANAIGNDQLRRFIEKHGEPVPLTIRMQEAESRAERLAEALREAKMRIAAIGYPASPDGEYSKDGEWTFSDAVPRAVDAEEVEAAFLVIRTALAAQQGGRADGFAANRQEGE